MTNSPESSEITRSSERAPGYTLPISEAAAAIRCVRHEALRLLDKLKSLQLIRPTLGGPAVDLPDETIREGKARRDPLFSKSE